MGHFRWSHITLWRLTGSLNLTRSRQPDCQMQNASPFSQCSAVGASCLCLFSLSFFSLSVLPFSFQRRSSSFSLVNPRILNLEVREPLTSSVRFSFFPFCLLCGGILQLSSDPQRHPWPLLLCQWKLLGQQPVSIRSQGWGGACRTLRAGFLC